MSDRNGGRARADAVAPAVALAGRTAGTGITVGRLHRIKGVLTDAVVLLLVIWLFPLVILAIGAPIAWLLRMLIDIVNRP